MTGDSESSRRAELEKIAGEMPDQYRAMILLASWCALRFGELTELRRVEGASHMAEGYTRAKAGNIGICVGTSGPAGTDMITGLYSASADSIPILAITGHAPVARLHKEDFQAVDIAAIAAPVTKMAMTVLEPAHVPGAFAQAFHLMRSGRPGPVLIDLPIDVRPRGTNIRDTSP